MSLLTTLFISLLCSFLLSCQVEETKSSGGLVADNKPAENRFTFVKPTNGFYKEASVISMTLRFPFVVTVTGVPRIPANIGGAGAFFNYSSGTGTKNLAFTYVIAPGDTDTNGITIASPIDLNGGTLKFFSAPLVEADCNLVFNTSSTSSVIVDTTEPIQGALTEPNAGLYSSGQALNFTLAYDEVVRVTGVPRIELDIGGVTKYATYVSGTNTTTLTFRYTVVSGDKDLDDIDIVTHDINGGTILDRAGNVAPFTITGSPLTNVKVQDVPTRVTSVSLPTNGTYTNGEPMSFTLNFNRAITITGTPRIEIAVGASTQYATYDSGSGTSSLIFTYTPADPDLDSNGIVITADIDPDGGTLLDSQGDALFLTTFTHASTSAIRVDAVIPVIASITPPSNGNYLIGQNMNFTVVFSRAVTLTGSPTLDVDVGPSTVNASYVSGSGTTSILFRYIPSNGEEDLDGVSITALSLNGGTINTSVGNPADLTLPVVDTSLVNVSAILPTLSSFTAPVDDTYLLGTNMDFTVDFDRAMTVTGTPRVAFATTDGPKFANYFSGSGTTTLTFRYVVTSNVFDYNGIVVSSPIDLNGGTIRDTFNYSPGLSFTVPDTTGVIVDASPAFISSVSVPTSRTYGDGEILSFTATFSKNVTVTGTPRIPLTIGVSNVFANYLSGSGTTSIVFRKVVASPETDMDGIAMTSPVALNGGTIRDSNSINATLTYTVPSTTGVLVDSGAPFVTAMTVPSNNTYLTGQNLNFILDFNENVTVTGTPRLTLNIGGTTRYATYVSGNGTSTLSFRYTTLSGDSDANGIGLTATIDLNSGNITDASLNVANLTLAPPSLAAVLVDAVLPTITTVSLPANGVFTAAGNLNFTVNYNKPITVSGTPRIVLVIGASTVNANYLSGSGTSALTFRYTIPAGSFDMNGIAIGNSNDIDLNGGTLRDAVSNDAQVSLGAQNLARVFVSYPGLGGWYDVNDSTALTTVFVNPDFTISVLADRSGNARDLSQGTAGNRPFYLSSGFGTNNTGYINTNTAVKFLNIASAVPNIQYIITVFRTPATLATASLFTSNTTGRVGISATGQLTFNPTAQWKVNGGGLNATTTASAASTVTANNNYVMTARYGSGQTIATQRIGHPTTSPIGGRIAEMLIFTSTAVLTDTELTVIHNYLNAKHGVY